MTSDAVRPSSSDRRRYRAFLRDLLPGVVVIVALQSALLVTNPEPSGWSLLWSLAPLLPAVWIVVAQVRRLQRADERERLQQLAAMAVGFGTTIVLAFVGGLLDAARVGSAAQWLQVTFIGGVLAWIAALAVIDRRT